MTVLAAWDGCRDAEIAALCVCFAVKKRRRKTASASEPPGLRLGLKAGAGGASGVGWTEEALTLGPHPPQGMGGQHNYFGLWVDVDFGKGHSKAKPKCTTYHSPQLSAQEDFRFEKMEVWAVGEAPGSQQVSAGRRSACGVSAGRLSAHGVSALRVLSLPFPRVACHLSMGHLSSLHVSPVSPRLCSLHVACRLSVCCLSALCALPLCSCIWRRFIRNSFPAAAAGPRDARG